LEWDGQGLWVGFVAFWLGVVTAYTSYILLFFDDGAAIHGVEIGPAHCLFKHGEDHLLEIGVRLQ
jgi:hypothetical protein